MEVRAVDVGAVPVGVVEVRQVEVRPVEVRAVEVRAVEVGVVPVGVVEMREVGAVPVGAVKVWEMRPVWKVWPVRRVRRVGRVGRVREVRSVVGNVPPPAPRERHVAKRAQEDGGQCVALTARRDGPRPRPTIRRTKDCRNTHAESLVRTSELCSAVHTAFGCSSPSEIVHCLGQ